MATDFGSAARRFCSLIEEPSSSSLRLWLAKVESALADVYAAAIALPDTEPVGDLSPSWRDRIDWTDIFEGIRARLGHRDAYWQVFDPSDPRSVAEASLADDLTDVYREVSAGLAASRSGAAPEDVLFAWRTGFEIHWGSHAVNALRAIRETLGSSSDGD